MKPMKGDESQQTKLLSIKTCYKLRENSAETYQNLTRQEQVLLLLGHFLEKNIST